MEGRAWIAQLPAALARQAGMLERLLDAVETDERFRAFELRDAARALAGLLDGYGPPPLAAAVRTRL